MQYSTKRRYSGNESAAFSAVESTLLPNGFRIIHSGPTRLELKGRGMQSTKENPVRGATEISVETAGGSLRLNAKLGGVRFMAFFVCLFPLLLWGSFAVTGLLKSGDGGSVFEAKALYGAAVWLVIGPLMTVWIRKRTISALDDMMDNAVVSAGRT